MYTITARNAADGLRQVIGQLLNQNNLIETRNGPAYTFDAPLLVELSHPHECFVGDPVRDANPFFALAEAFWLLAGRDDTTYLDNYVKTFGERYADQGILLGSYGKRWRSHFGVDQLKLLVDKLRADPSTRQAVLQMWAPTDLTATAKDRPCNTSIMFRIRDGRLDVTVTNRSNDVWNGLFGYNPTQFNMLQRVIADQLGIPAGKYWVMTNDAHFYYSDVEVYKSRGDLSYVQIDHRVRTRIVDNVLTWENDLQTLMAALDTLHDGGFQDEPYLQNSYLKDVVFRACAAYHFYRKKKPAQAWYMADLITDPMWRTFCINWLQRRIDRDQ